MKPLSLTLALILFVSTLLPSSAGHGQEIPVGVALNPEGVPTSQIDKLSVESARTICSMWEVPRNNSLWAKCTAILQTGSVDEVARLMREVGEFHNKQPIQLICTPDWCSEHFSEECPKIGEHLPPECMEIYSMCMRQCSQEARDLGMPEEMIYQREVIPHDILIPTTIFTGGIRTRRWWRND